MGGKIRHLAFVQRSLFTTPHPGWIVTYIIDVRGGGMSSGYISTGFFGGESVVFHVESADTENQD